MKKQIPLLTASILSLTSLSFAEQKTTPVSTTRIAPAPVKKQAPQKVEICFVLDTTGSMSGLIEGAKRKIWTIANHIVQNQNAPEVKFSLIGYRDRGDQYITKTTPLTDDLDALQQDLNAFKAAGGGDHPESVNQALFESIQKIKWSEDKNVKKIVFLVGDAPPHMDYPQDVTYITTCEGAKAKGIIINTLQCGAHAETTQIWAKIAMAASGTYSAIPQNGGTQAISCPQDKQLSQLSIELNDTVIPYGNAQQRADVQGKCLSVHKLSPETQAARASYNFYQKEAKAITGNEDLITEWQNNRITTAKIKKDNLPEKLRDLTTEQLTAEINKRDAKRKAIQTKINDLVKQRNEYLKEAQKNPTLKNKDAFDQKIKTMLNKQLNS